MKYRGAAQGPLPVVFREPHEVLGIGLGSGACKTSFGLFDEATHRQKTNFRVPNCINKCRNNNIFRLEKVWECKCETHRGSGIPRAFQMLPQHFKW